VAEIAVRLQILLLAAVAASGQARVDVRVTGKTVTENFTGVGFHAEMFMTQTTPEFWEQVIAKRWRELNPAFARVFHQWAQGRPGVRDPAALDGYLKQFLFLKEATATEVYFTTGNPKDTSPGEERRAYARAVVDELEYLIKGGATNLTTYCMSNELSLNEWAELRNDLPKFRDYHQHLHGEIARRGLKVALLATDASPVMYWNTLEWAAANMDAITGVYGGHHYANDHPPEDPAFYEWFKERCAWGVGLARSKGKEFILGEFGPAQYLQHKFGVRWDTCRYFGTAREPLAGLQLAEAALAAMNGGVRALGYWTFMDYPDNPAWAGINQWGLFKWLKNGAGVRAPYYSYGLLAKFFRGPARVLEVETGDARVRAGAIRRRGTGQWSIAVIRRAQTALEIALSVQGADGARFRRYEYDTRAVPVTEDGDLQLPDGQVTMSGGRFGDRVKPMSLTVYTTAFDDDPPAPVEGLRAERFKYTRLPRHPAMAQRLAWQASPARDVIYYRVYHGGERIGSTVALEYVDADVRRPKGLKYGVVAVDGSGNPSPMRECAPGQ
jgi:hypothetical protein